jgi:hypothetical protein
VWGGCGGLVLVAGGVFPQKGAAIATSTRPPPRPVHLPLSLRVKKDAMKLVSPPTSSIVTGLKTNSITGMQGHEAFIERFSVLRVMLADIADAHNGNDLRISSDSVVNEFLIIPEKSYILLNLVKAVLVFMYIRGSMQVFVDGLIKLAKIQEKEEESK